MCYLNKVLGNYLICVRLCAKVLGLKEESDTDLDFWELKWIIEVKNIFGKLAKITKLCQPDIKDHQRKS